MDPQTPEAKSLQSIVAIFLKDLNALPEEVFDKSLGGVARTVADIVYEVNLVNDHICLGLRGEPQFPWPDEGWIRAPEGLKSKAEVISSFERSSQGVLGTVNPYSAEAMLETVTTERGQTPKAERCRFMTLHLMYHSGQLNFIQTLIGDSEWHW